MRSSLTDLAGPLHAATILDDARLAQKLEGLRSPPDLTTPPMLLHQPILSTCTGCCPLK